MRRPIAAILLMVALAGGAAGADSPAPNAQALAERGAAAMRDSFQRPVAIIDAAIAFSEARKLYQATSDVEHVCEMQAYLFWCKKRMNLDDLRSFVGAKDQERLAQALAAADIAALPVAASEAQAYFDRAQAFAQKNPERHLEIAVRFFEVAERFAGTDVSLKAQRISLDEQQKHLATLTPATPETPTTTATASAAPGALPASWQQADIGMVGAAGSASVKDGAVTVIGSGGDIWGNKDAFHFVWQPLNGDGAISARLPPYQRIDEWEKVGLMIRADPSPSAANAFMMRTFAAKYADVLQMRGGDGADTGFAAHVSEPDARWLKLERAGSTLTGSISTDGATWTTVGSTIIALPRTVCIGFAVTSHHEGALATVTFADVRPALVTASQPRAHAAMPDAEAAKAAAERLRQTLKADYAKTAKKDRRLLATRLLAQARTTTDDPATRWACLAEASELAVTAGDPDLACAPFDAAADWFANVDAGALKKAALARIGGALASAMTRLLDRPTDAESCTLVGRHLCFDLGRWDEGVKLLINTSDHELKHAAEMEAAAPTDASQQAEIADAWRAAAVKQPPAQRAGALARAQWWYLRSLPLLSGMTLEIAAKRLGEIADALPDERLDPRAASKKRWDAIKGKPLLIQGNVDRMDTGVVLAAGQRALVFPQPGDSWSAADTTTDARGLPGDKLNGFAPGEMVWAIDGGTRESVWNGPCAGSGHLMLGANRAKDGGKGGSIPAKIIVVEDD